MLDLISIKLDFRYIKVIEIFSLDIKTKIMLVSYMVNKLDLIAQLELSKILKFRFQII